MARQPVRRKIQAENAGDDFLHAVHEENEDGVSLREWIGGRLNCERAGQKFGDGLRDCAGSLKSE